MIAADDARQNFVRMEWRRRAIHKAIGKSYAECAAGMHRSARQDIFLAARAADHGWNRRRYGLRGGFCEGDFNYAAAFGTDAWGVDESFVALGEGIGEQEALRLSSRFVGLENKNGMRFAAHPVFICEI